MHQTTHLPTSGKSSTKDFHTIDAYLEDFIVDHNHSSIVIPPMYFEIIIQAHKNLRMSNVKDFSWPMPDWIDKHVLHPIFPSFWDML